MAGSYASVLKFLGVDDFAVIGRTRINTERFAQHYGLKHYFIADLDEALGTYGPSHIIAAVSLESQFDVYSRLVRLTMPIQLLLEKPIALNVHQASHLLDSCHDVKSTFVGMNRRHYESVKVARTLLDSSPRSIWVTDQEDFNFFGQEHPKLATEGALIFANSIHLVDLVRTLARGSITAVNYHRNSETLVRQWVLDFESGDTCYYSLISDRPGPWSLEISSKNIFLQLSPLEVLRKRGTNSKTWTDVCGEATAVGLKPGLLGQLKEFLNLDQGSPRITPNLTEAFRTVQLANYLKKS